ncbi:MAG: hypothetical protein CTY12_00450 [Methylotenera sp.]|nr:MAG: hypothetical protein CTY12_00450 [Methylotenera sp.]
MSSFEQIANIARAEGQRIEIERTLPAVTIYHNEDTVYHFQEWAAEEVLAEVPLDENDEDYLLAISQGW